MCYLFVGVDVYLCLGSILYLVVALTALRGFVAIGLFSVSIAFSELRCCFDCYCYFIVFVVV